MGRFQRITKVPGFLVRKSISAIESIRGRIDRHRLQKRYPLLQDFDVQASVIRKPLKPPYKQYTSTVSTEGMAISFRVLGLSRGTL